MTNNIGILLTNIGTPSEPTSAAVRFYLKKFLSDKRVVEIPSWIWWPILYGFILPFRSRKSAKLYQSIWTDEGSPLLVYSKKIAAKLEEKMQLPVALGMHYSSPSIEEALNQLKSQHISRIIILPLYPQYSGTTTAATFDAVAKVLNKWRVLPEIQTINHYANHPLYIQAICVSIQKTWYERGSARHLLFSFHGIPKRFTDLGDPYPSLCEQTVQSVVNMLKLPNTDWSISFQSRVGRGQWTSPYTQEILTALPKKGITEIDVICPGFATDCLETLEEINIRSKKQFLSSGGKSFHYIPALNDSDEHIAMLEKIILNAMIKP
jgi:ferrochelatase